MIMEAVMKIIIAERLAEIGITRDGLDWVKREVNGTEIRWVPLVEAKMLRIYMHY